MTAETMVTPMPSVSRTSCLVCRIRTFRIPSTTAAKLHALDAIGCGLASLGSDSCTAALRIATKAVANRRAPPSAAAARSRRRRPRSPTACSATGSTTTTRTRRREPTSRLRSFPRCCRIRGGVWRDWARDADRDGCRHGVRHPPRDGGPIRVSSAWLPPDLGLRRLRCDCCRRAPARSRRTTTVNAIGIAGSMASGLFAYLSDGSQTKPIHAGWAAHSGILAARLAAHGATGPAAVFEDRFGIFTAFTGDMPAALDEQFDDLGARWETPRIALKPFPACHFVHACLEALRSVMDDPDFDPEDVREIEALVPADAVPLVLEPVSAKLAPAPATRRSSAFSTRWRPCWSDGASTLRRMREPHRRSAHP